LCGRRGKNVYKIVRNILNYSPNTSLPLHTHKGFPLWKFHSFLLLLLAKSFTLNESCRHPHMYGGRRMIEAKETLSEKFSAQ
jgi:hypothetical protein